MRNNFSKVASAYAKYRKDYPKELYQKLYEICPNKDAAPLDVGCGTGIVTKQLAQYYDKVIGADIADGMLDLARNETASNATFINANAENLPFPNNTFDLITVATAYHWFDYDSAGKEIYRVLKDGGSLCVFVKSSTGLTRSYLPEFCEEIFKKYGGEIKRVSKERLSPEVFTRNHFTSVNYFEIPFSDEYTKDELIGYLESHSICNLLTEEQKKNYISECRETADTKLTDGKFVVAGITIFYQAIK